MIRWPIGQEPAAGYLSTSIRLFQIFFGIPSGCFASNRMFQGWPRTGAYVWTMENSDETRYDDHAAEQYLRELVQQASAGIMAAQATRMAALGAAVAGDVFVNARAVANAAAMISKVLWPGQMRKASSEDKQQFERRKQLSEVRGPALREALGVSNNSPLKNRAVRDAIEHFDERLDRRLSSPNRNIILNSLGPLNMIHIEGETEPFYLHHYDPETTKYTILGDSMSIAEVENAFIHLFNAAMQEQAIIQRRKWGPPEV